MHCPACAHRFTTFEREGVPNPVGRPRANPLIRLRVLLTMLLRVVDRLEKQEREAMGGAADVD